MSKFYITTAIDYVNASPHIGHALEKVLTDAIARYQRLKGRDVFFSPEPMNTEQRFTGQQKKGV